jgi:NO-binding membrane sensor protein with MHYT domain
MAGMRVDGVIGYSVHLVVASLLIAIVAATVALWFTVTLNSGPAVTVAALIMGVAVCGMHYTGMAALHVRLGSGQETVSGVDPVRFMVPVIVVAFLVITVLLLAVITGPTEEDIDIRTELFDRAPAPVPLPAPLPQDMGDTGGYRARPY